MSGDVIDLPADLRPIAAICDGEVSHRTEGQRKLIFMQGLRFLIGDKQHVKDAVLCLNHENPTYPTRLYLAEKVGNGLNWHEDAHMLGRHWYTFSWRGVAANQSPFEILAVHLDALRRAK